jgi:hypothetical protein
VLIKLDVLNVGWLALFPIALLDCKMLIKICRSALMAPMLGFVWWCLVVLGGA